MNESSLRLLQRLRDHGRRRSDAAAFLGAGGAVMTYAQLAAATEAIAASLRQSLPPGAVVILSAANQLGFPAAFFGILAAGCSVFPVSAEAADAELARLAAQVGALGVLGDERAVEILRPAVRCVQMISALGARGSVTADSPSETAPHAKAAIPAAGVVADDPPRIGAPTLQDPNAFASPRNTDGAVARHVAPGDLLLQSSGTTGLPKIIRRGGASLDRAAEAMVDSIGFDAGDRVLMTVPLTHSYGLEHGLLAPVWAGSSVALCRGLDMTSMKEFLARGVTLLPGVPSTFEMLAQSGADFAMPSMRRAYSAGGPLPRGVFDAFAGHFNVRVAQLYGASEIGSVTFEPRDCDLDPASVGRAMKGVSIRILDLDGSHRPLPAGVEGQVAIAAGSMFSGYLDGGAELIDGHFATGDLGRLDESGRLFLTGRIKLLIDVGGLKVNPLEVEALLAEHPAVGACIVIPVRQSETVFRLKAIVTPRQAGGTVPLEELRALARRRLSGWKIPRLIEVRPSLPRSATGKLLRHLVEAGG